MERLAFGTRRGEVMQLLEAPAAERTTLSYQPPLEGAEPVHAIECICEGLSAVTKSSFFFLYLSFFLSS